MTLETAETLREQPTYVEGLLAPRLTRLGAVAVYWMPRCNVMRQSHDSGVA